MVTVSSWGRLTADPHNTISLSDSLRASNVIACSGKPGLAHGMGRSYGDVCLNPGGTLWLTTGLDHVSSFDVSTGRLVCEAGMLLRDIQKLTVPKGWILPVTPGTQLLTVGGAIANDVHGKNHHKVGSFGDHIKSLTLVRSDGDVVRCNPTEQKDLFEATIGGLGLTGVIIQAEIQLHPVVSPWLDTETIPYSSLDEFFHLADESEDEWDHTVSWIDCLSGGRRGIFMRGNFTASDEQPEPKRWNVSMPFTPPFSLVNRASLRPFNLAYYNLKKYQPRQSRMHYESFFYPLDNLLEWNRMYGPKGFYQYQCVLPREVGLDGVQALLEEISRSHNGSFLAVLKTFGEREAVGMLSFPRPGVTLALDFPNQGTRTKKLFERLDRIVAEAQGRLYLAKDARM